MTRKPFTLDDYTSRSELQSNVTRSLLGAGCFCVRACTAPARARGRCRSAFRRYRSSSHIGGAARPHGGFGPRSLPYNAVDGRGRVPIRRGSRGQNGQAPPALDRSVRDAPSCRTRTLEPGIRDQDAGHLSQCGAGLAARGAKPPVGSAPARIRAWAVGALVTSRYGAGQNRTLQTPATSTGRSRKVCGAVRQEPT